MLIAAQTEQEVATVAYSEEIPADNLDNFDREVVKVVHMKERVYVSCDGWFRSGEKVVDP